MPGLTLDQLNKMGAKPIVPQNKGMTFEQLKSIHEPTPPSSLETQPQNYFQDVLAGADKRADTVGEIEGSNQNILSKGLQIFGQGAGLGDDIISKGIEHTIKAIPGAESAISGIGSEAKKIAPYVIPGGEGIKKLWEGIPQETKDNVSNTIKNTLSDLAKQHPEAAGNIEAIGNILNLGVSLEATSAGAEIATKGVVKTAEIAGKVAPKIGGAIGTGTKYLTAQATGLSPSTISNIVKNPGTFSAEEIANIDRSSMANEVKTALDDRLESLSETGKEYESIKQSGKMVTVPKTGISDTLSKYGIEIDRNGKIISTKESLPMSATDKNELQSFLDTFYTGEDKMSANAVLNARTQLSNMSKFESTKTGASQTMAKELRKVLDTTAKNELPELASADAKYAPEKKLITKLKKDYLNPDGTLKDNAISKIANIGGKGKEKALERLEQLVPGIKEDANILKSIEDIQAAEGQKVGAYMRVLGGGAGFAAGGVPGAIVGAILLSPKVAVGILRAYGELKNISSPVIESIIGKMSSGTKLTGSALKIMDDAVKNASAQAEQRIKSAGGQAIEKIKNTPAGMSIKDVSGESPLIQEAKKYKSAEEFVNAQFTKKPEYGMSHRPSYEGMPPAYNLLEGETLPRDVYTHPDYSISSGRIRSGDKAANESWNALQKIKDNPEAEITVYRAGAKNELNNGDWITFSKDYAKQSVEGTEKVHSFKIKAKDAIFAGDDINEFGYYPKEKLTDIWNKSQPPKEVVKKAKVKSFIKK